MANKTTKKQAAPEEAIKAPEAPPPEEAIKAPEAATEAPAPEEAIHTENKAPEAPKALIKAIPVNTIAERLSETSIAANEKLIALKSDDLREALENVVRATAYGGVETREKYMEVGRNFLKIRKDKSYELDGYKNMEDAAAVAGYKKARATQLANAAAVWGDYDALSDYDRLIFNAGTGIDALYKLTQATEEQRRIALINGEIQPYMTYEAAKAWINKIKGSRKNSKATEATEADTEATEAATEATEAATEAPAPEAPKRPDKWEFLSEDESGDSVWYLDGNPDGPYSPNFAGEIEIPGTHYVVALEEKLGLGNFPEYYAITYRPYTPPTPAELMEKANAAALAGDTAALLSVMQKMAEMMKSTEAPATEATATEAATEAATEVPATE